MGSSVFLGGQPRPHPKGARGASASQIFVASYMCAHRKRNYNQILHSDQTRCEETFFQGRPRTLTHDLFAVANRLVSIRVIVMWNSA